MLILCVFFLIWIGIDYLEKGYMFVFNIKNGGVYNIFFIISLIKVCKICNLWVFLL